MIGSDRDLFVKGSAAQKRTIEYGELFTQLHIIVFAGKGLGFSRMKISENVFLYPTNHRSPLFYLWNIYRTAQGILRSEQGSSGSFVISCQDPFEAGLAGWLLHILFKVPLQLQVHTDLFSPYFAAESFKNRVRVMMARFLLRRADGIRVVSERIKRSLSTFDVRLSTKVKVLPIFVDAKKIQQAKVKVDLHQKYPEYRKIVLMASRLTKEKHIGLAIEAVKRLHELLDVDRSQVKGHLSRPESGSRQGSALLLIVGDGPEKESLQRSIVDSQLSNVVIEPWTSDMASYYRTADCFLLTSDYEGYGRTVIEAMAAGLSVVMTDVGIAGELFVDGLDGIVAPVGDPGAVAEALWAMLGDPGLREGFAAQSAKVIGSLGDKKEYLRAYRAALEACMKN